MNNSVCHREINSYPNKWHKFLTWVLIRAVNRQSREAVSMLRGEFEHFNTPEVHMNTQWSWREDGSGMACTMSHRSRNGTWLVWVQWGHLGEGGCHVTMRWMRGPLLTTKRRVFLISQCQDKRAIIIHYTSDRLRPAVLTVWLLDTTTQHDRFTIQIGT